MGGGKMDRRQAAVRDAADHGAGNAVPIEHRQNLLRVVVESERRIEASRGAGFARQRKRQDAKPSRQRIYCTLQIFPPALDSGNQNEWRAGSDVNQPHNTTISQTLMICARDNGGYIN
jgi:hypothetical protein